MNFILRLLLAGPVLVAYLLCAVVLCLYCGLGWIFTGHANVKLVWPEVG